MRLYARVRSRWSSRRHSGTQGAKVAQRRSTSVHCILPTGCADWGASMRQVSRYAAPQPSNPMDIEILLIAALYQAG
ncbi:hypothetical protein CSC78_04095 [Pseudoxanthomonas japonensis]|uniref:Uncharacterized protein n=1 Tax=Pseudoxanthomonas japonensis TaxID=69284 RepID=A0ABQ6ZKL3_9GAMM|nr:hypothetical protein CSC78_04095 [Pseudoxanthomonas japonensis]